MTRFFTNLYITILVFCTSVWAFSSFFWLIQYPSALWSLTLSTILTIAMLILLNDNYIKANFIKFKSKPFALPLLLAIDLISYGSIILGTFYISKIAVPFMTPKSLSYAQALQAFKRGWNPILYDASNLAATNSNQLWSHLPRFSLANYYSLSSISGLNTGIFLNLLLIIAGLACSTLAINKLLPRNLNLVNRYFWRIALALIITCNPITLRLASSLEVIPQIYALYLIILSSGVLISKKKSNIIHWTTITLSTIILAGLSYFALLIGVLLPIGIVAYHKLNDNLKISPQVSLAVSEIAILGVLINFNPYIPKLIDKLARINATSISQLGDKLLGLINQQFNTVIPSLFAMTGANRQLIYSKLPFVIDNAEITVLKNPNLPLVTGGLGLWFGGVILIWILGNGYLYWLTCLKPKQIGEANLEEQMIIKFHHQRNMLIILIYTIFTVFLVFLGLLTRDIFDLNQLSFWWLVPCSSLIVWLYFDDARLDIARQVLAVFLIGNCLLTIWLGIGI